MSIPVRRDVCLKALMSDFGDYFDGDHNYGNVPYDPDSKPDGLLGDIFNDYGWSTWGDFYDDKLNLNWDDPVSTRPPILGDIVDVILDFNDRGILDWARFEFRDDGFIDYEIDVDS